MRLLALRMLVSFKKCNAIQIKMKMYIFYSVNFRPPEDRKPTSQEIKNIQFLKEHISIINPKY